MKKYAISLEKFIFYVMVVLFIVYQVAYAIGQFVGNPEKVN